MRVQKYELYKSEKYDKIVLSVEDSGIGISVDEQELLFKLFGKLQSSEQANTGGIGCGLMLCKLLA